MRLIKLLLVATLLAGCAAGVPRVESDCTAGGNAADAAELLPGWNRGPAADGIIAFLQNISDPDSPGYVDPEARLAVFDLDGTLLIERPFYTEVLIAAERLKARAAADPQLQSREPYKSVLLDDEQFLNTHGWEIVPESAAGGESVADFRRRAGDYFINREHPRFKRKYKDLFYTPMIELIRLLKRYGFDIYIVSASDQDLIRIFAESCLGITDEAVIGSVVAFNLIQSSTGDFHFERQARYWDPYNADDGKVERIFERTGRLPILTVGNSTGDLKMFEATAASDLPFLNLVLDHDDPEREYEYHYQSLLDQARSSGWTIVSIKNDFKNIFETSCPLTD